MEAGVAGRRILGRVHAVQPVRRRRRLIGRAPFLQADDAVLGRGARGGAAALRIAIRLRNSIKNVLVSRARA